MKERILCVDDEKKVVEGLHRNLRTNYEPHAAGGGAEALETLRRKGPFAVVISDLRMPGMDGLEFLDQVRQAWPDTVRILLTGQADLDATITAINRGRIFRFLCKPSSRREILDAVEAGVRQYRLVTSERVLLEETLMGSIKMLTDMLAMVHPEAYGRATRLRRHVEDFAGRLGREDAWAARIAALLSPLGWITLPQSTVEKLYHHRPLGPEERKMVRRLPAIAEELLDSIPRLEPVQRILAYQEKRFDGGGIPEDRTAGESIPIGARLLKIVNDYDSLIETGLTAEEAIDTMSIRRGFYDPELLRAFAEVKRDQPPQPETRAIAAAELCLGMILAENVVTRSGRLLVVKGQEITAGTLARIRNFRGPTGVREPIWVHPTPDESESRVETVAGKETP
ncbi:MAG: response regulator [Candidatus Eisenbacteria bacterium]|nr:response regulator [Candidatus Eisenbacteria bacterium]